MLQRMGKEEWAKLVLEWEDECTSFKENFEDYAAASLPVLQELACSPPRRDAAVFGLSGEEKTEVICQANSTLLPGYAGKVLRIRHIVLSPRFDFSEVEIEEYSKALIGVLAGAVRLADEEMPSEHVKFHLKSPAERSFGKAFTEALSSHSAFRNVAFKGSWIYLSKA